MHGSTDGLQQDLTYLCQLATWGAALGAPARLASPHTTLTNCSTM